MYSKLISEAGQPDRVKSSGSMRQALRMFSSMIQNGILSVAVFAAGLGLPVVTAFSAAAVFVGCSSPMEDVEYPRAQYEDQTYPFGTADRIMIDNYTLELTIDHSTTVESSGLKILLDEYYKRNPGATEITFKFDGISNEMLKKFTIGLLDKDQYKEKNPDHSSIPYIGLDMDSTSLAEAGITLNETNKTITIDLTKRDAQTASGSNVHKNNYIVNDTVNTDGSISFDVAPTGSNNVAYLGLVKGGLTYSDSGYLNYNIANLPASQPLTVVLDRGANTPALHFKTTGGNGNIPLSSFREDYLHTGGGAVASFSSSGTLNLGLNGLDSYVSVQDTSATKINIDVSANPTSYLKIKLNKPANLSDFLSSIEIGLNGTNNEVRYFDPLDWTSLDISSADKGSYYEVKIPMRDMFGAKIMGVAGVFFKKTTTGNQNYEILSAVVSADGSTEHTIPLTGVDKTAPFSRVAFMLETDTPLNNLSLSGVQMNGQNITADESTQSTVNMNSEIRGLTFSIDPSEITVSPLIFTITASGEIVGP